MPSLSQRYRPKTFAEITGQSHVTETLRKEVATGTLGHAYLFSGPRGVGKTTAARVFAKALNCAQPKDGEPCNTCAFCLAANSGKFLDLIELDAATHTGVETVREAIIEHARFAPMMGKRKIYVLDEAHMLSTSSWNALLKTLEEPPTYAFFILATTEWHKVPATIVSRCQRFEFKRIADDALGVRVKELAKREGWKIGDDVVRLIVSRADGCVRDAETLLGQLGALGESEITLELANLVIPESHLPLAVGLMERWASRDHAASLQETQRLFDEGIPFLPLFDDLIATVRRCLVVSGASPGDVSDVKNLVGKFEPGELHDMALMLMERRKDVKGGVEPLFALQLAGTLVANGLLRHAGSPSVPTKAEPKAPVAVRAPSVASPTVAPKDVAAKTEDISTPAVVPSVQTVPETVPAMEPAAAGALDLATVRMKWNALIRAIDEKNHSLPFILKISRPEAVHGNTLVIRFQYPFHRDKIISDPKHRKIVEDCAKEVLQCGNIAIEGIVGEDAEAKEQRSQDIVSNILKAFGGQVVE